MDMIFLDIINRLFQKKNSTKNDNLDQSEFSTRFQATLSVYFETLKEFERVEHCFYPQLSQRSPHVYNLISPSVEANQVTTNVQKFSEELKTILERIIELLSIKLKPILPILAAVVYKEDSVFYHEDMWLSYSRLLYSYYSVKSFSTRYIRYICIYIHMVYIYACYIHGVYILSIFF